MGSSSDNDGSIPASSSIVAGGSAQVAIVTPVPEKRIIGNWPPAAAPKKLHSGKTTSQALSEFHPG